MVEFEPWTYRLQVKSWATEAHNNDEILIVATDDYAGISKTECNNVTFIYLLY